MNKAKNILYNYLCDAFPENIFYYDLLNYELDKRIYYYGEHFRSPHEGSLSLKKRIKRQLLGFGVEEYVFLKSFLYKKNSRVNILSTIYFNVNTLINDNNMRLSSPPWADNLTGKDRYNYKFYKQSRALKNALLYDTFETLVSEKFINEIKNFEIRLKQFITLNKFQALFIPMDVGFFERLTIKVFKELQLPTFNFIHGLPGIYNVFDYNRADFLVVWGQAIKDNEIKVGVDPDKIIVSGHPKYSINIIDKLKFSFDDILIVTKALAGAQYSAEYIVSDRSCLIYYLISIQGVLKRIGIKKVRFRVHPSENPKWYLKFIDNEFFEIDSDDLNTSLSKSSVVIGPVSTVFLESLIAGVNYVVYEPKLENGRSVSGYEVIPPFDGKDSKIPAASNTDELEHILNNKVPVDIRVLEDYMAPKFDLSKVIDLIVSENM